MTEEIENITDRIYHLANDIKDEKTIVKSLEIIIGRLERQSVSKAVLIDLQFLKEKSLKQIAELENDLNMVISLFIIKADNQTFTDFFSRAGPHASIVMILGG
jgi:thymidine kinase